MRRDWQSKNYGGARDGAGRKPIGESKTISLTLSKEAWEWLDESIANGHAASRSELIRNIVHSAKEE